MPMRHTRDTPASRRRVTAAAAACLTAGLLAIAPSAWAEASAGASTATAAPSVSLPEVSPAEASEAAAYWTPERRAAAVDVDSGLRMSELEASQAAAPISTAEQVAPVSHIGRIFYTQNGSGYACTANVVESANRSTIATAGHCITQKQKFSTDIVFYPAYESGRSSYGAWPVIGGAVTPGWFEKNNDDQADDSGFLAVQRDADGDDIATVVGASPVLFGISAVRQASAYGYPASRRFDGKHLERCRGVGEATSSEQIALKCDMNEGVSGGPIFAGDDADAPQFANVAERYWDYSHILGPVWQSKERSAYDVAAAVGR